jgi:ankyrin repeat protein
MAVPRRQPGEGTALSLLNLSIHNETNNGQRGSTGQPTLPRPNTPDPRQHRAYHSTSPTKNVRHAAAPGAPGYPGGDDDSPPPSDDNDSVGTIRDRVPDFYEPRTPPSSRGDYPSPPSSSNQSQRAHGIRDELQRMSIASSYFQLNQQPANPMVENIHRDLVRLQEIMLELRRNGENSGFGPGTGIPPGLEAQIERLFDQVRDNLRAVGNPDEQILRGTNIHSRNASGETALHIAAKKRPVDVAAIRKFLNLGASARVKDHQLNTPLLSLISTKYTWDDKFGDAVSLFLNAGVDVDARSNDGWTALDHVAHTMETRTFGTLVPRVANLNATTRDLLTPLHRTAQKSSLYGVALLLSRSANPNAISTSGETPLSIICQCRCSHNRAQATIIEYLLDAGARLDAGPAGARRPLDAVIIKLKDKEQKLKSGQFGALGRIESFIWSRNEWENSLYTIQVLLRYMSTITLQYTTRTAVQSMYVFRPMRNLEAIPIVELRRRFKQRIGEIVALSNRELYDDMQRRV